MKAHGAPEAAAPENTPLVAIASATGPWLTDVEGRRYLDGVSSWWTNLFGHGHPAIRAALVDQLATLDHVMLAGL
ncbi:MAG TPA: aminotransferase class III-fold pyridoxal phosphate-dependent enzyme, partial [Burkholderiaceae bacterium]